MAQALAALMAKLEWAPRLVVGHSAGAAILARLIADGRLAPELFVAINGAFLPFRRRRRRPVSGDCPSVAGQSNRAAPVRLERRPRSPSPRCSPAWARKLDARGLDLYVRLMRNPEHCAGALAMMANWDLSRTADDLARIACPSLLVVGANDSAIRAGEGGRRRQADDWRARRAIAGARPSRP